MINNGTLIVHRASQFSKGVTGKVSALIRSLLLRAPCSISVAMTQPDSKKITAKMPN